MKTHILGLAAFVLIGLVAPGCKKKKKDDEVVVPDSGYVVGLKTTSAGQDAEYLLSTGDLMSGTISASGVGVEQMGWMYYHMAGNKILAMDYTNNICTGYTIGGGSISESGSFVFERMDALTNIPGSDNIIAIGAPWGGGSYDCFIQTINTSSMSISSSVATPLYELYNDTNARLNMWPTQTYIENGKLFVSFYPLHGASWDTDRTDTAYVSVYSYPGMVYQHTFKDTRTSPIGYYGGSNAMVTDESGNHYTFSTSSIAAGFTQATKPSGILRINAGAEQFDPGYFFNVESHGYKMLTGTYAGNGKVVARVIPIANDAAVWGAFEVTNAICKIAILDLNAQTVTIVNDVPLHGGQYYTPFYLESGMVYISVNTGSSAYVYRVDPATATAQQGAAIDGSQLQYILKY